MENLLPHNGILYYYPGVFNRTESEQLMVDLLNELHLEQKSIRIFNRQIPEPRLTAWHGDADAAYSYSGIKLVPKPWTPGLLEAKQKAEELSGKSFNSVLVNLYRDGNDSMGWHRDNENELGAEPCIASLSFGAERSFQVREYKGPSKHLIKLPVASGSLLIMAGNMQQHWQHRVPKQKNILEPRLNLTFRRIY